MKYYQKYVFLLLFILCLIKPVEAEKYYKDRGETRECPLCDNLYDAKSKWLIDYLKNKNAILFQQEVRKIYALLFVSPTVIICQKCHFPIGIHWLCLPKDKEKNYKYIESYPNIKTTDFDANPWLKFEYAAKIGELNSDVNFAIATYYLLSAWTFCQKDLLDKELIRELEKSLQPDFFANFYEAPGMENPNSGPTIIELANSFISMENKARNGNYSDNEKALLYLAFASIYFSSNNINKTEHYLELLINTETIKKLQQTNENIKNIITDFQNRLTTLKRYNESAKKYFELSLNDKPLIPKERTACYFLLGELERSYGNNEEAKKYYDLAVEGSGIDVDSIKTINYIVETFLGSSLKNKTIIEELEIKEINKIFEKFEKNKLYLDCSKLRSFKRQDLILPHLKKYISSNDDALLFEIYCALPTGNQESIDMHIDLLKRGKFVNDILTKIRFDSNLIKKSDDEVFINIFNKENYPRWNIISYLITLDTDNCRKAILTKAKELLSKSNLIDLAKKNKDNPAISGSYEAILNALAQIRTKESIELIANTLNYIQEDCGNLNDLGPDKRFYWNTAIWAGHALETAFNISFGFVHTTQKRPDGRLPENIKDKPLNEAYNKFCSWYIGLNNSSKTIEEINQSSFKKLGYDVFPPDSIKNLDDLIEGLKDSYDPVRINCYRELVKRTGILYRACDNYDFIGSNTQQSVNFYKSWLEKNKDDLEYDKAKQIFSIKSKNK